MYYFVVIYICMHFCFSFIKLYTNNFFSSICMESIHIYIYLELFFENCDRYVCIYMEASLLSRNLCKENNVHICVGIKIYIHFCFSFSM